ALAGRDGLVESHQWEGAGRGLWGGTSYVRDEDDVVAGDRDWRRPGGPRGRRSPGGARPGAGRAGGGGLGRLGGAAVGARSAVLAVAVQRRRRCAPPPGGGRVAGAGPQAPTHRW